MNGDMNNDANNDQTNQDISQGFYSEFAQSPTPLNNQSIDNNSNNEQITNNINNNQNIFIDNSNFEANSFNPNVLNNNLSNHISNEYINETIKKDKKNNRRKKMFAFLFILLILVIGSVITIMVLSEMKLIKLPWLEYPEVVNLSQNELMLKRKATYQFTSSVYPSQVHFGKVIYESSNPDIATINPTTGYVDAKNNGVTTIKAYLEDYKDIYDTCELVVSNNHVKVENISVENENIDLMVGNKYQLKYSYTPPNAGVHYFTYLSSDISILSVNTKGEVTALSSGKAMVTILDEASGNKVDQEFTVYARLEKSDTLSSEEQTDISDKTVDIEKIVVSSSSVNLVPTGEQQIIAEVFPAEANQKITWKSINSEIATVTSDGLIMGIEVGNTEIIATAVNGMNKVIKVSVQTELIEIESMNIVGSNFSLNVGASKVIGVDIKPKNATNQKIIWKTSDSDIVKVDQTGKVTGISEGSATITAETLEEEITSSIVVTVKKVSNFVGETDLQLSSDNVEINVGATSFIKATVLPSNASNKKVTWRSNNPSVATIKDGMITGKGPGTTSIIAKTNNKGIEKIINVKVNAVEVKSISLSESSLKTGKGGEISLYATIIPSNATNKTVTWSSSNTTVATVNRNGLIEAKNVGTAIITAISSNGIKAKCTITVTNESIPVNTLNLNNSKIIVKVNGQASLTPIITPATATNQHITWSINNTNIATVSTDGTITGKKEGIVTITAKTNNGKSASASVIIKNNGASVNYLDGTTIKYWVDNSYGNYAISHIWVKDAYNQLKTEMPDKLGNLWTPYNLLKKAASKNSGKTIIGTNASGFTNSSFEPKIYNLNKEWKNTSLSPVIFYEKRILRDFSMYKIPYSIYVYAISKDGNLNYYRFTSDSEKNKEVIQNMQDNGVKYTFSFNPVLVENNNKKGGLNTNKSIRQSICQIDKNNFILITSTISGDARSSKGLSHTNLADKMVSMGCKIGFNLDGGGSASLYYVKKGSTTPTKIKVHEGTYGRAVPDVLYFVGV